MGMESALVKTSDIPFKISFYPETCPESWGEERNDKNPKLISCWSYFQAPHISSSA